MVYYTDDDLLIRSMEGDDAQIFYRTFLSYGWHPSLQTYENYYKEQERGARRVFVAVCRGEVSGYCTLVPQSGAEAGDGRYPRIVDLSVFKHMQNRGIGNKLLDVVEQAASQLSDRVYLAVGLHSGYGAAQRIYAKRGYLPDGTGVWYRGKPLGQYEPCCNDDSLQLWMSKALCKDASAMRET